MKVFVTNNIVLFILVVTTTIDASRVLYLPLPKIYPSNQHVEPPKDTQEIAKNTRSDEFIPPSAIEQEEIEKRGDAFDWEELLDQAATKRRIVVNEVSPEKSNPLREQYPIVEPHENSESDIGEKKASADAASHLQQDSYADEPWIVDSATIRMARLQSNAVLNSNYPGRQQNNAIFFVVVGICCLVGSVGLVAAAIFWYKVQKRAEAAVDSEYPSYGVTGPASSGSKRVSPSSSMSDRKLAQSAQMFHYQQQRQQMMAQEKAHLDAKPVHSDDSDDETPAGGDYTVYECPGLAPTGEMEVRNPLFAEPDSSLISPSSSLQLAPSNPYSQSSSPPKEKLSP